jgi:tetratricopeptide (TPR) repeat protein
MMGKDLPRQPDQPASTKESEMASRLNLSLQSLAGQHAQAIPSLTSFFYGLNFYLRLACTLVLCCSCNRREEPESTPAPAAGIEKTADSRAASSKDADSPDPAPVWTLDPPDESLPVGQKVARLRQEEERIVEQLMQKFPEQVDVQVLYGVILSARGNKEQAAKVWHACLEMAPERVDIHHALGLLAIEREDYVEAASCFKRAAELDPSLPVIHNLLGRAYMGLNRFDEAESAFKKDLESGSGSVLSMTLLAQLCTDQDRLEDARALYEQALEVSPDDTTALYGLAMVLGRLGLREDAQEVMGRFQVLKREEQERLEAEGETYEDLEQVQAGVSITLSKVGKLLMDFGAVQPGLRVLKQAAGLDERAKECRIALLDWYRQRGSTDEALVWAREFVTADPEDPSGFLNLGAIFIDLGRLQEARAAFQQACRLAPERGWGFLELARLELKAGSSPARAVEYARTAVEKEPTAHAHFVLAWALEKSGDRIAALTELEKALELDPENPQYRNVYSQLRGS